MFSMKRTRKEKKQWTEDSCNGFRNLWTRVLFANRLSNRGKVQGAKTRTACGLFLKQRGARSLPTRLKKRR
jgi:hypothetical protein